MEKFGASQAHRRFEDIRFLTGAGQYVEDTAPDGALYGFVFRSPVAHARITALDVSAARDVDGVALVLTAQDLLEAGVKLDLQGVLVKNRDGSDGAAPTRPLLAHGKLRFVGEAVAMIFASSLQAARDAAELIELDYDELPAKLDLGADGEKIHDDLPDNRAFDWGMGDEAATDSAIAAAAHVVKAQVDDNRVIVNSLEPRGCWAEFDGQRLHLCVNGQGVWNQKRRLVEMLGLAEADVRVTNPDVGGGFGMKAMTYPEYYICAQAARMLGQPVRWMSDRTEAMLSDNGGRDLTSHAVLAFDADYKLTAYKVHSLCNMGAYNSQFGQAIQTQLFSRVLPGVYDLQTTYLRAEGFYTNTVQMDAYRGAGRPEAIYLLERMMDRAARVLGVDPLELRRRNFIPASAFPYAAATGETYDVGDFHTVLDKAVQAADLDGFAARRAASQAAGRLRGLGLCYYIESILGDPSEGAKVVFDDDGGARIFVGTQSNGQGHETVYATFLSDQTGIPVDKITVVQGDSDQIAQGGGTGGSRSVTVQANATLGAVTKMVEGFTAFLADMQDVSPDDIEFDHQTFRIQGSNLTPTMLEVAQMAREAGRADLLSFEVRETLPARSFPNGAHFAEVEVDPDTGRVTTDRYTVVDDFGNLINPMLAEGQVHCGIAQGLGQALCERVVYDEDGQLLTATFMDYAMPRAADLPMIGFSTHAVPSTANPMGMKGCGEAGTVGAMAAVANAVQDALWDQGVHQADMPFTPMRVWQMLQDAKG